MQDRAGNRLNILTTPLLIFFWISTVVTPAAMLSEAGFADRRNIAIEFASGVRN
jgi:hypothetical protein